MSQTRGRVEILLVEDNPPDVKLLQECLRHVPFPYQLHSLTDGEAALAFLRHHVPYTTAPRPDLLLLDIHLPKQSGWDVLAWVRATAALSSMPVVMLTGIFSPYDEEQLDQLRPTRCLLKPREPADYLRVSKALEGVMWPLTALSHAPVGDRAASRLGYPRRNPPTTHTSAPPSTRVSSA